MLGLASFSSQAVKLEQCSAIWRRGMSSGQSLARVQFPLCPGWDGGYQLSPSQRRDLASNQTTFFPDGCGYGNGYPTAN